MDYFLSLFIKLNVSLIWRWFSLYLKFYTIKFKIKIWITVFYLMRSFAFNKKIANQSFLVFLNLSMKTHFFPIRMCASFLLIKRFINLHKDGLEVRTIEIKQQTIPIKKKLVSPCCLTFGSPCVSAWGCLCCVCCSLMYSLNFYILL